MVLPISSHEPSSLTAQKKWSVRKSLIAITTMNSALGATPSLLFKIPKLAEINANGTISFNINNDPWENGSKTGISRYTASSEKEETEAILPVLKKADWIRVRKKTEIRASERVRERKGEDVAESSVFAEPLVFFVDETTSLA
jgi:hypothetical protein